MKRLLYLSNPTGLWLATTLPILNGLGIIFFALFGTRTTADAVKGLFMLLIGVGSLLRFRAAYLFFVTIAASIGIITPILLVGLLVLTKAGIVIAGFTRPLTTFESVMLGVWILAWLACFVFLRRKRTRGMFTQWNPYSSRE